MNKKTIARIYLTGLLVFFFTMTLPGQEKSIKTYDLVKYDLFNSFENNKLEAYNRQISQFSEKDKRGIHLSKNENDGIAWLKGIEFSNGTIELDIKGKNVFQQSFIGVAFHGVDNKTLDAVYFRPFNFQSTDPVHKIHAVQYVSHPENTWNLLREKQNGKYEKAVIPAPDGDEWFHAKIVIHYPRVTVYVNGNTEPSLSIDQLNNRKTGKIGLWVGNNSDGDFANLQLTYEP
ncbi:MAG: family 16 glycoside hydrolase [Bacteroidales bacterium]